MSKRTADVSRAMRTLAIADVAALTDRDLLNRFVLDSDQAAFAALVRRHSAMVFGVCRRSLGRLHDAEDACQAVFVLLARKAGRVRWRESIVNWLYTTARNVAGNARIASIRRARREGRVAVSEAVPPSDAINASEMLVVLDEELEKLPPRYREPLVLCYLEALTRDEAARRLGVPEATLKSQLERGRKKLSDALTYRGCALGLSGLVTAALSESGAFSPKLLDSILAAVSGAPSGAVALLIQETAMRGLIANAKWAISAVVALAVCGVGMTVLYLGAAQPPKDRPKPSLENNQEPTLKQAKDDGKPAADANKRTFTGRVIDRDGKPVAGAKIYYCFHEQEPLTMPATIPVRATTDENGRFAFTLTERDVPKTASALTLDGDAVKGGFVVAKADGLTWAWEVYRKLPTEIELTCAKDTTPLTGRIVDLQGKPIAGVRVLPLEAVAPAGDGAVFLKAIERGEVPQLAQASFWRQPSLLLPATTTDADGRFRLDGYPEKRLVKLRFEQDGIETTEVYFLTGKHEKIPAPKRAAPDKLDNPIKARRRVDLKANGEDYVAAPGLVVTGTVRDAATGKPISGATVETMYLAGAMAQQTVGSRFHTTADADGHYRLGGLPHTHGSRIRIRGGPSAPHVPAVKEVPETKLFVPATLDVALSPGVWIDVTTIDRATGKPVPGTFSYTIMPKEKNVFDREYLGAYDPKIPIGNDGLYRFAVPDRAAVIRFLASRPIYPVVADAGMREPVDGVWPVAFQARADVQPKADSGPVKVNFTLDSGRRIKGKVIAPDGGAIARVFATGLEHDWYNQATFIQRSDTFKNDEFEVLGVEPGKPRLVCFLDPKSQLAGFVVVHADEKGLTTVKLQAAASVKGRLLDVDGKPVKSAKLDLIELPPIRKGETRSTETGVLIAMRTFAGVGGKVVVNDYGFGPEPVTDDDGRFVINGLVPGLKHNLAWFDLDRKGGAPVERVWKGVVFRDIVFKAGEAKDLGDVKAQLLSGSKP